MMNYSISKIVGPLHEGKAFATRPRKMIDLRALEARAYAIVHKREYPQIVARETGIAVKKLTGVKRKMRSALMREIRSWKNENIDYKTLVKRSYNFIEATYREAYLQGIKSQGHGALRGLRGTKLSPTNVLTPEDLTWIKSAAMEELKYWSRFMGTMIGDREPLNAYQERRLNMYVDAVNSVFDAGRVAGAGDWVIIDWVLGEAEHCPECLYLAKHSPYTKNTLPCTPRAGCTRCLSNCKCRLVLTGVDEKRYHQIERMSRAARHMRRLEMSRKLNRGLPEVASMLVRAEVKDRVEKVKAATRQPRQPQGRGRRR